MLFLLSIHFASINVQHAAVNAFSITNGPRNALRIQPNNIHSNNYPKSERREGKSVTTCRSRLPLGPFQPQKKTNCIVGHPHSLMVMTSPDNMQNTSSSPDDDIHSESNKEEFPVLQSQQVPVAAVSQELETPPSGPSTSKPKKIQNHCRSKPPSQQKHYSKTEKKKVPT